MGRTRLVLMLSLAAFGCRTTSTASTGTETSSGGESGTSEAEESGWVPEDLPSPWHCNPITAPCPDGEKCTIVYEPLTDSKCVPIPEDPVGLGEACELYGEGLDNCPDASACFAGECKGLCDEQSGLGCPEGEECGWHNNTNSTAYCETPCHPLEPGDCEADEQCVYGNAIGFECEDAGDNLAQGELCEWSQDCADGLACVSVADEMRCKPYCSLIDGGCEDPDVCVSWWYGDPGLAPPGYEDLGVCLPP